MGGSRIDSSLIVGETFGAYKVLSSKGRDSNNIAIYNCICTICKTKQTLSRSYLLIHPAVRCSCKAIARVKKRYNK